ncbi:hypothetical protein N0V90_004635 [Kalmusia sp. IMI 367209]|nr:hypothetical protein N0V90_004635 [Kalmusia sp. IMI 367209]
MAIAEQPTEPAFTRMPVELLGAILEHAVGDEGFWRIIQFAYLPSLLDILFGTVRFIASAKHADIVAKTDLGLLKGYVKGVVFEPSKESWITKREMFEEIILVRPFEEAVDVLIEELRSKGDDTWWRDYETRREEELKKLGIKGFTKKYLPKEKELFSDEEIEAGYEAYTARANAAKAVIDNGELAKTWARALGQLERVEELRVGQWEFDQDSLRWHVDTKDKGWKELGVEVYGHGHPRHLGYAHEESHCRGVQVPVGEALFSTALKSVSEARVKIKRLDIEYVGNGKFAWADDGQLDGLDLSNLQELIFRPRTEEIGESIGWDRKKTATLEECSGLAVEAILKKCAPSLTYLELLSDVPFCVLVWPPEKTKVANLAPLPALTSLKTGARLNLATFPAFLKEKCTALTSLELQSCGGKGNASWRGLWDAIRYHPQRMHLSFEQIPCNDAAEVSLVHYTGDECEDEEDEDPWMDIDRSLSNYLSNKGKWNKSCRMWFEDEGSDDDDDENGSGGSDGEEDDGWEDEDEDMDDGSDDDED